MAVGFLLNYRELEKKTEILWDLLCERQLYEAGAAFAQRSEQ